MPPNYRQDVPLARHERKAAAALVAALVMVGALLAVWEATGLGGGGKVGGPCVNVVIASSTGGATVTHCGKDARSWCAAEAKTTGAFALQAQAACRRSDL